jgi:hypothetical protein
MKPREKMMTDKMKTFLTRAASKTGVTASMFNEYRAAMKAGWIKPNGYPQNSMTMRYVLTEAGRDAAQ